MTTPNRAARIAIETLGSNAGLIDLLDFAMKYCPVGTDTAAGRSWAFDVEAAIIDAL